MTPKKPTAFFVDTDDDHRESLKLLLTDNGYNVRAFSNGAKLLRFITGDGAKIRPSLVIIDVTAEGLGGFEAARRITQMPNTKEVPIIMMAKYCCPEDKLEAQSAGAITCLQKPLTYEAVVAEIAEKKKRLMNNTSVVRTRFKMDFS